MPEREDLSPELNRMMDRAGLTGSMYERREPFMKVVIDVRQALIVEFQHFIAERDQKRSQPTPGDNASQQIT